MMGPHVLDLLPFFFGEPCQRFAQEFRVHPRFAGEDIGSIVLGYEQMIGHCTTGADNLKAMWLLHRALASARRQQALSVAEA
jgi:predicted dehydrogenase